MGISFFLPWVTFGDVFSGYDFANMYSRMHYDHSYLRFTCVPKVAFGILVLVIGNAPRNFIYYIAPVMSLIPIVVLDGIIFEFQTIHYGIYLLHFSIILIWIGAFSYKFESNPLVKSAEKIR